MQDVTLRARADRLRLDLLGAESRVLGEDTVATGQSTSLRTVAPDRMSEAIAACERLGALPELARAHRDTATWDLDLGDGRSRDAHLARARELFEVLGLPWATEEAEAAARRAA